MPAGSQHPAHQDKKQTVSGQVCTLDIVGIRTYTGIKRNFSLLCTPSGRVREILQDSVQYCIYLDEHLKTYENFWMFYTLYRNSA